MKILLTGVTGYIGRRLLPVLVEQGHEVIACARRPDNLEWEEGWEGKVELFQVDFLEPVAIEKAPLEFDAAYYLIHSMSNANQDFSKLEAQAAQNFANYLDKTTAQQIIYLSGMTNQEELSKHLNSRLNVEHVLGSSKVPLTTLRAGIVIGSGSASFEIIRDIVEKLPIMVAPRWLKTRCQPIAIRNVIQFLTGVLFLEETYHKNYDIACDEILTYQEMLEGYAKARDLNRLIFTVPVMTPRLSSYWLYFVTSTTYPLAVNLVNSMKIDVIARDQELARLLNIDLINYKEAVQMAFAKIEQNLVVSSWKDALVSSSDLSTLGAFIKVPKYGCFIDAKELAIQSNTEEDVWANVMAIGGERGWYYANWLWKIRGYLDKLVGGIGLRRGRTNSERIIPGDALDFWRVLDVNQDKKRLLLYAEMKLPGEAWLEFNIKNKGDQVLLQQTATFRPSGILGRLYWYSIVPLHYFIFNNMIKNVARFRPK